ncbi:MAG: hypothetical protein WB785_19705 [Mycobacterium sp.]
MTSISIIGLGNMASALADQALENPLPAAFIAVARTSEVVR